MNWLKLIGPAIQIAESVIGAGNGQNKLAFVTSIIQSGLLAASIFGAIPMSATTDLQSVTNMINTEVARMNNAGELPKK